MEASGKHYLTCLWPGLPEMWFRGQLAALPAAVTFALAVNFLLVARFIYPEWLAPLLVKLACWAAVGVWIYCVAKSVQRLPEVVSPRAASDLPDRFAEAHVQYLRGHWVEAEALLSDCLEIESRDPPALLLLAGVYRHTNRLAAAANLLDQLERLERGDYWWLELQDERKRLQRFEAAAAEQPAEDAAEPPVEHAAEEAAELSAEDAAEPSAEGAAEQPEAASKSAEPPAPESDGNRDGDQQEQTMQGVGTETPQRHVGDSVQDLSSAAATDQAFAAELAEDWPVEDPARGCRTV